MKRSTVIILICIFCILLSACSSSQRIDELSQLRDSVNNLHNKLDLLHNKLDLLNAQLEEDRLEKEQLNEQIDLLNKKVRNLSALRPKFTEEAPIYTQKESFETLVKFDHHNDADVSFQNFFDYCKNEITYNLTLLSPIMSEDDFHPNMIRTYSVLTEKETNDLMIFEHMMMQSKVLGYSCNVNPNSDGSVPWSLELRIFIKPTLERIFVKDITLRFGNNNSEEYWREYINIYYNGDCFATCYYHENAYVSIDWYYDYFTQNLTNVI